jgi:8-oxo-dGTP pyrophosphatase MutT (NUDIX family)
MSPAIPHAATVVILRDTPAGLEVLLTKRAAGLSFMANLWVFPGGRMEPSDHGPEMLARIGTADLADRQQRFATRQGERLDIATVHGLHVAACRETFEEAGLMLGRCADGRDCDPGQLARLASRRAQAATADGFLRLLVEEDLVLNVGQLTYWSHWITPSREGKRFDTRFFVVELPGDQEASADLSELTQHAWLAQAQIEAGIGNHELALAPPTHATLQDIWFSHAQHGSVARMLRAERLRPVPPVLPKFAEATAGITQVLLPWDREYAAASGEGYIAPEGYPAHLTRLPSRWSPRFSAGRNDPPRAHARPCRAGREIIKAGCSSPARNGRGSQPDCSAVAAGSRRRPRVDRRLDRIAHLGSDVLGLLHDRRRRLFGASLAPSLRRRWPAAPSSPLFSSRRQMPSRCWSLPAAPLSRPASPLSWRAPAICAPPS